MRQKRTLVEIRAWLKRQGYEANPIGQIDHHEDGTTTLWLTSLNEPLTMPAPKAKPRKRKEPTQ